MKTILVTGGAGYVGSHCCKEFAAKGWTVVVYDNLYRGWRDMVKWGELIEGDILDRDALQGAIARVKPDVLAHFAALTYVGESVEHPDLYYRNNTLGTFNILEAMRAEGVDKMIFSSTAATYGEPLEAPMPETHRQLPINPYGWSKLMVERMMFDYAAAYGLRFAALRYFNAAGASADGEIGERHEPETHVIPLAARGALRDDYQFHHLRGRLRHPGRHLRARLRARQRPRPRPRGGGGLPYARAARPKPSTWGPAKAPP